MYTWTFYQLVSKSGKKGRIKFQRCSTFSSKESLFCVTDTVFVIFNRYAKGPTENFGRADFQ